MNAVLVAGVLIVSGLAAKSGQQRDSLPQVQRGTASVSGRVVIAGESAQPARRAIVSMEGNGQHLGHHAITDDEGRFRIERLPAGKYTLAASRPGFVTIPYGAARPGFTGKTLVLTEGEHVEGLDLVLMRGAVITGVIRDWDGRLVPGIEVSVLRRDRLAAGRSLTQVRTDDKGVFRAFGLAPGTFIVSVQPRPLLRDRTYAPTEADVDAMLLALRRDQARPATAASNPAMPADREVSDLVPTYFPGAFSLDDAEPITLRAGEERTGVDLTLQLMASTRIQGRILSADGPRLENVRLYLIRSSRQRTVLPRSGEVKPDGSFQFSAVEPGRYLVAAISVSPGAREALTGSASSSAGRQSTLCALATEEISVSGSEVQDLILPLRRCLTLDVGVAFRESTANSRPPNLDSLRLSLEPIRSTVLPTYVPPRVPPLPGPDQRFVLGDLGDVLPGVYRLRAEFPSSGPGTGWSLVSSTANGRDILDASLVLTQNSPDVTTVLLTFTDQHSSLSGRVEAPRATASDHTVIVFPKNSDWWQEPFRRVRSTKPATDGQFRIEGLPPGEYYLAALVEVAPDEWLDSTFLNEIVKMSLPFTLHAGEHKIQNLKIER
jgi:hypothetical protein